MAKGGSRVAKLEKQKVIRQKSPYSVSQAILRGDIFTKLSMIIMGFGSLVRGQIVKGLFFLSVEVGYIFYLIFFGANSARMLRTLGEKQRGKFFNEATGMFEKVDGDNSMLLLLGGVLFILITVLFICMWCANLKASMEAQIMIQKGKKAKKLKDDIRDYLDSKFHRTVLFFPILSIVIFNILPLLYMILVAFTNYDGDHPVPGKLFTWNGIESFKVVLGLSDSTLSTNIASTFWPVFGWTMIWAFVATFSNYFLGMLLALLINRKGTKLKPMWRTIFVLSIAIPSFVSLLVMRTMLSDTGAINMMLQDMGLIAKGAYLPFLSDPLWARVTVIIVNLWIGIPYTMLVTTGVLQNIPEELFEAAKVDGANPVVIYFKITLPYMIFVTTPHLITSFVGNINNFNVIYFLTGGGPNTLDYYQAGKTDLLVTWLFKLTTVSFDYNYASVLGIFIFIISAVLSIITFVNSGSYKREEEFQ